MANQIALDVYEFGTGNSFERKYTQPFIREHIVSYDSASIYNYKNQHFTDVRSKITYDWGGVLKDFHVAQTVAQIKTALDA
jgi:hypothetical protein